MNPRPIALDLDPRSALDAWPADVPLAAIWSGGPPGPLARWTILGAPSRAVFGTPDFAPLGVSSPTPIFQGGWIGVLGYDLGRTLEPAAQTGSAAPDRDWPDQVWLRCDDALVHDRVTGLWWEVGKPPALRSAGARAAFKARLSAETTRDDYVRIVGRALDYIRAGDVYQVNLAHRLSGAFDGSARGYFAALTDLADPWYGAYAEWDQGGRRRAVASASPEQFLSVDPGTGRVTTRPMKGTRRAGPGAEADLAGAGKDAAELAMIVDLMRNDLGRVCELGSVRVDRARDIERHAGPSGVIQATATISGVLARGAGVEDLLRASFPPGSVTGAPKVRAMQIIDELEPVRRGAYCGAIGFVSDSGHAAFNVAIRTASITGEPDPASRGVIRGGRMDYSVGAGIVAESDPEAEWDETLGKAGIVAAWTASSHPAEPATLPRRG